MKNKYLLLAMTTGACAMAILSTQTASAINAIPPPTLTYDATVTTIKGTGNLNTDWTLYNNPGLNLSLGFKAQYTYAGFPGPTASPNNGSGTFLFAPGSTWNFWFDINVNPNNIPQGLSAPTLASSGYDFYMTILGPEGLTPTTPFNVLSLNDNAYGDNSTANGAGTVGTAGTSAGLQSTFNIAQNSGNLSFGSLPGFDPNATGDYDFSIFAVTHGADATTAAHAGEVDGVVSIEPVPEPTTIVMFGLDLFALVCIQHRRNKNFHR